MSTSAVFGMTLVVAKAEARKKTSGTRKNPKAPGGVELIPEAESINLFFITLSFALDCCDREAIGWVASTTSYSGTALRSLAIAFEHYNELHPLSALKYRSPREFRRLKMASS